MERNRERRIAIAALGVTALTARDAIAVEGGLELMPDPLILVLLIVFFAALVPLVNQLLLRPMLRVLDARTERAHRPLSRRLDEDLERRSAHRERPLDRAVHPARDRHMRPQRRSHTRIIPTKEKGGHASIFTRHVPTLVDREDQPRR